MRTASGRGGSAQDCKMPADEEVRSASLRPDPESRLVYHHRAKRRSRPTDCASDCTAGRDRPRPAFGPTPSSTRYDPQAHRQADYKPTRPARPARPRQLAGAPDRPRHGRSRTKACTPPHRCGRREWAAARVILFYCLFALCALTPLTSAQGPFPDEPLPDAQPLVYMLRELGSGDGTGGGSSFQRASSMSNDLGSGSTNGDVSPALIEARCWNNYENDNDCKQLNVITAPERDRPDQHRQSQHQYDQQDDRLITPVVIFEASSTIEPSFESQKGGGELETERPLFMAPPYQPGNAAGARVESKKHKQVGGVDSRPESALGAPNVSVDNPSIESAPVTRPTVIHYVVTPQPKNVASSRRPSTTAKTKTTTQGRKCRDDNDADCDEPEDNQVQTQELAGGDDDADDNDNDEDDDDDKSRPASKGSPSLSSFQTNLIHEAGSGAGYGGHTDDDTDDSNDDGDDDAGGEVSESSGASPIQESSPKPDQSAEKDSRLLVITSSYPGESTAQPAGGARPETRPESSQTPSPATSSTRRPKTGAAEIEVVVHSTLPPSFPLNNNGQPRIYATNFNDYTDAASTTTSSTTTMLPDDTYTSKPIFPSSTLGSAAIGSPDEPNQAGMEQQSGSSPASQTTTELDLYTFKPIPIPVEQSEVRPSRFESAGQTDAPGGPQAGDPDNNQQQQPPKQPEFSSQHIHEPAGHKRPQSYDRSAFDDGWTTRKPSSSLLGPFGRDPSGSQQEQTADVLVSGKRGPAKGYGPMGHDILSTMLLYASITIVVFTSLIVIVIAYMFRRRNNFRRQAMLAKAQMMNGRPPGMIESMSHVSHLMHGPDRYPPQVQPPQQGLMSTYAHSKGSNGKVTTSLVKPIDQADNGLVEPDLEDEEGAQVEQQESRQQRRYNARDQELAGDEESILMDGGQQQARSSRLVGGHAGSMHNQSGSWSTEDPTTTTTTSSGSQRTQDGQQPQHPEAAMQNGQRIHNPYPNSLSDGRQNSSSISDSQCSPDPGPSGPSQPMSQPMQHPQQPMPANQVHMVAAMQNNQHFGAREMIMSNSPADFGGQTPFNQRAIRPALRPAIRLPNGNGLGPMGPGAMPPNRLPYHPMMLQNGDMGGGIKQRLVASRSIEDIQPSQHVGFVDGNSDALNMSNQHHVPYSPLQQPHLLPHLIQARPRYQFAQPNMAMAGPPNLGKSSVSPQRIAMSPLATLSRKFPPGAGLNRNIYSEDSSSFMTTSPSLARTSSSSSFAFNMSNLPTPSSVKAKPLIDASGRMFNDYTPGFNDHPTGNGDGPPVPPVFGRNVRSEAWYV